ncbi:MAG: Hsp20/alpha crystallin family protein [Desulfobacteraceae bacterium]|jgi:HSP20 family protein
MAIFRWRGPFYEQFREFKELNRLQDEVNRLYESFFGKRPYGAKPHLFPGVNVWEDDHMIYVTAELPGVEAKDVDITVEEESLAIKGVRKIAPEAEAVSYHRKEREEGAFNRKISLPVRIAADKAHAESKDGVLMVVMPKAEEVRPRKVEIKVE